MSRFLVVHDHLPTVMALMGLLSGDGHRVAGFTSKAAALDALTRQSFDVVVTDQEMPCGEGTDLVEAARACLPDACVVAVSARAREQEEALLEAGASLVIDKPFDYDHLMHVVSATLALAHPERPPRV